MELSNLTERESVLKAIEEYDNIGSENFFKQYGYAKARKYHLKYKGRYYPSKAIVGVAWKHQFGGNALSSKKFNGGLETVVPVLKRLGFAVQTVHQNPDWTREEVILALNLYFNLDAKRISSRTPEIVQLSNILISLPLHPLESRLPTFRNPNGVANKLSNFLSLDPHYNGAGYGHHSQCDEEIWKEFYGAKDQLAKEAKAIVAFGASSEIKSAVMENTEDEELSAPEGRLRLYIHRRRERYGGLPKKKKNQALKKAGHLVCEVCKFDFELAYSNIPKPFIECHHNTPLSQLEPNTETTLEDLSLVCANCHRMLHAFETAISVEELRRRLRITFDPS